MGLIAAGIVIITWLNIWDKANGGKLSISEKSLKAKQTQLTINQ